MKDEMRMRLRNEHGDELHVEEHAADVRVTVRYFAKQESGELVKQMEVTCFIMQYGDWIPLELARDGTTTVYGTSDAETGRVTVRDGLGQAEAAGFCDRWALTFLEQGFLATAAKLMPLGARPARRPKWPEPTTPAPELEQIEEWMFEDGGCEATDSCWVEPDGICPHGHPSWLLRLGLV